MARFSKFYLLYVFKKIDGVNFILIHQIWLFQKVGKSQNKVAVAEEICIVYLLSSDGHMDRVIF